ncbi:MAG TPA: MFS transporter [Chloroflexia bacterium]|nr:MFS transporter [Chloroflexia bacterium]
MLSNLESQSSNSATLNLDQPELLAPVSTQASISEYRRFKRSRLTWLAYLLIGLYSYLLNSFGPLMPFLRDELKLSATEVSLHFSGFALGMIGAGLLGPVLTNRWGRKPIALVGGTGMVLATIPLIFGHAAILTIGSAFFTGLLGTLLFVTLPAVLAEEHGEGRVIALTEANVSGSLFATIVPVAIGIASGFGSWGWRGAIGMAGLVLLVLVGWLSKTHLPAPPSRLETTGSKLYALKPSPLPKGKSRLPARYWLCWGVIVLAVSLEFSMISWSSPFLETVRGFSKGEAASAVSLFLIAMLAGRMAGSRLLSRWSARYLIPVEMVLTLVGFGIFWLSSLPFLSLSGLVICGLGVANLYPLSLDLALSASKNQFDKASAAASLASGVAIFTAPVVLGFLADHFALTTAYSVVLLFWLIMVVLLGVVYRRLKIV